MNMQMWVGLFGLLSVASAIYTAYDLWRRRTTSRSTDVVSSAILLLEPYKSEVQQLRNDLVSANLRIGGLTEKLNHAEKRATDLNGQLENAKAEIAYLRVQVKTLADQANKGMSDS